jgi:hypothetical protein
VLDTFKYLGRPIASNDAQLGYDPISSSLFVRDMDHNHGTVYTELRAGFPAASRSGVKTIGRAGLPTAFRSFAKTVAEASRGVRMPEK